jgi:hypothetical protein
MPNPVTHRAADPTRFSGQVSIRVTPAPSTGAVIVDRFSKK